MPAPSASWDPIRLRAAPQGRVQGRALILITAPLASGIVGVALSTTASITRRVADVGTASGQGSFRPPGEVHYLLAGSVPLSMDDMAHELNDA